MAKIYRVIFTDQYRHITPQTQWHTSQNYCENYINKSPYKACMSIESSELIED